MHTYTAEKDEYEKKCYKPLKPGIKTTIIEANSLESDEFQMTWIEASVLSLLLFPVVIDEATKRFKKKCRM